MTQKTNPDNFQFDTMMLYSDPLLGAVLGLPEVMLMWNKSRRACEMAMWRENISVRKMVSGGGYLVARASVQRLWGDPVYDLTDQALTPGSFFKSSSHKGE